MSKVQVVATYGSMPAPLASSSTPGTQVTAQLGSLYVGPEGKSAYEVAVEDGFVGTEQEWLDHLQGTPGKSAYDVAVEQGFVGTQQSWLASLQGAPGDAPDLPDLTVIFENQLI